MTHAFQGHCLPWFMKCLSTSIGLLFEETVYLVGTVMPIVQQTGGTDSGLFAIEMAFQAASGLSCNMKQERLRECPTKLQQRTANVRPHYHNRTREQEEAQLFQCVVCADCPKNFIP